MSQTYLSAFCLVAPAFAQEFGPQQQIAFPPNLVAEVQAADLDGDDRVDVVWCGALFTDRIAWSRNLGGGEFEAPRLITLLVSFPASLYVTDMDGDGDPDLLSASSSDSKVAWYENSGSGQFGVQQLISQSASGAQYVHAADLDGDGAPDVVSTSRHDSKVAWYRNLGGGAFGSQTVIPTTGTVNPTAVIARDLDGDGDPDLLVSEFHSSRITWLQNLGNGQFGPIQVISSQAGGAIDVDGADVDGDGDVDVLSASFLDNKVAWYENLGSGSFGPERLITTSVVNPRSVLAVDLDGDGDLDALTASEDDNRIVWSENLGLGSFGPQHVIASHVDRPRAAAAADFDDDGDPDVVAASFDSREVVWFENYGKGTVFCRPAAMNGAGLLGQLSATGSTFAADNALTLVARHVTPSNFALFLTSPNEGIAVRPPNSIGNLCLGAPIGRYAAPGQIRPTGPTGTATLSIDLMRTPTPTGLVRIMPGETWRFQCWHRDSVLGMATSNFTDAVSVTFR